MRRTTIGRIIGGGIAAVVIIGGGASAAVASGETSVEGHYRVATAALGDVEETLALSGTIATTTRRDESFQVGGTVDAIDVTLGQHVDAGDALATVGTDDLQSALDQAKTTLSNAQDQLDTDLAAQSASSSSGSGGTSGSGAKTVSVDPKALQQAIASLTAAQHALAQCSTDDAGGGTGGTGDGSGGTGDGSGDGTGDGTDPADDSTDTAACVTTASQQLTRALQTLQRLTRSSASSTSSGSGSSSSGTGSSSGGASPTGSASSKPTAETITADRATITADEAQVTIAKQALSAHELTAGISGTVAAIGFSIGDAVSAGSTTQVVTILGDDGYEVTTTVPLTQIAKVKAGEQASIELPALGKTYEGSVSAVGVMNVSTDSSTPAYDVTIAVDPEDDVLRYGSAASISVAVASVTDVLTVPLSAVTTSGGASTVKVLKDGAVSTVPVQLGATGDELVEITSGLSEGDEVVLADLDEGVPSSTSSTTRGGLGLTGGGAFVGGAGFPAGGFGGFGGTGTRTSGGTSTSSGGK